jgi:hypothetical protein
MLPFAVQVDEFEVDQFDAFAADLTKDVLSGLGHGGRAGWEKEGRPAQGPARLDGTQRPGDHYVAVGTKTSPVGRPDPARGAA